MMWAKDTNKLRPIKLDNGALYRIDNGEMEILDQTGYKLNIF